MTETAFETKPVENQEGTPSNSAFEILVGEGKKFSDPEALAKGKLEADTFVTQLQKENQELRDELTKRLTAEQMLDKIKEESKTSNENTTQMSEDAISNLVKSTVTQMTAEEKAAANVRKADAILAERYGDKRGEIVAKKAAEYGLTSEQLGQMAAHSPDAVIKLISDEPATPSHRPTEGSINTEALNTANKQNVVKEDTYAYFEELRKKDPGAYFSPRVQNRMMKLAAEKGAAFYN